MSLKLFQAYLKIMSRKSVPFQSSYLYPATGRSVTCKADVALHLRSVIEAAWKAVEGMLPPEGTFNLVSPKQMHIGVYISHPSPYSAY